MKGLLTSFWAMAIGHEVLASCQDLTLVVQADYDTEEAAKELSDVLAQIHRFEPIAT